MPGPKGDPGDPASDNQTISFDQSNLTISGGNSVPLTSLLQNLTITSSPEGNYLGISRGNSVLLATIEADGDPKNEIQDLIYDAAKGKYVCLKAPHQLLICQNLKMMQMPVLQMRYRILLTFRLPTLFRFQEETVYPWGIWLHSEQGNFCPQQYLR